MAYAVKSKKSGKTYFLHSKGVTLRGSAKKMTIYYFAGKAGKEAMADMPAGYRVIESVRTGLPILKKAGAKKAA